MAKQKNLKPEDVLHRMIRHRAVLRRALREISSAAVYIDGKSTVKDIIKKAMTETAL